MAAAWTPITKAAPITAAIIWAIKRVRRGPSVRKSATVTVTAIAAAVAPMAATTP